MARRKDPSQPQSQLELLPPDHGPAHPSRCNKFHTGGPNPEAIYACEWKKLNNARRGQFYLHHILTTDADRAKGWERVAYSRRDAYVAAAVVQWLGTNVGRGFVLETERKIKKATDLQWTVGNDRRSARRTDTRTPLKRRKETLDAARERISKAVNKDGTK